MTENLNSLCPWTSRVKVTSQWVKFSVRVFRAVRLICPEMCGDLRIHHIQFVAFCPWSGFCRKPCVTGCASKPFGQQFPGCSLPSHCLTHSRWRFVKQQVKPLCLRRNTVGLEVLGEISKKAALPRAAHCVVLSIPFRFVWASGVSTVERSHALSWGSRGAHWSKVLSKDPHFCLTSALAVGSASAYVDTDTFLVGGTWSTIAEMIERTAGNRPRSGRINPPGIKKQIKRVHLPRHRCLCISLSFSDK